MDPKKRKLASWLFMGTGVLIVASVIVEPFPVKEEFNVVLVIVAVVVFAIGAVLGRQS